MGRDVSKQTLAEAFQVAKHRYSLLTNVVSTRSRRSLKALLSQRAGPRTRTPDSPHNGPKEPPKAHPSVNAEPVI